MKKKRTRNSYSALMAGSMMQLVSAIENGEKMTKFQQSAMNMAFRVCMEEPGISENRRESLRKDWDASWVRWRNANP